MVFRHAAFATFPDRATARATLAELPTLGLANAHAKLLDCRCDDCGKRLMDGLMSNSTWAESDGRRGLLIGVSLGGLVGTASGAGTFAVLGMSVAFGLGFGAFMGVLMGATMSGIVGAGLVNPTLARAVRALEPGQALLSVSSRTAAEHALAVRVLRTGSLAVVSSR